LKTGKKHLEAKKKIAKEVYKPEEAIKLVKDLAYAKFDETVEAHFRLGVDPKQADQQVRGVAILPNGTGKNIRVLVFAQGEKVQEAKEAGADFVGGDDLVEKIQKGWLDFDAAVSTPDMMSKVGRLGRILGPRRLMPNPKVGTVTFEVAKAVKDLKAGRVEYRTDKYGIIHVIIGKISFSEEQLLENYATILDEIARAKPSAAKGRYLRDITLASTMGPGVRVDPMASTAVA
jgi:large subunit ribosomal protein L1